MKQTIYILTLALGLCGCDDTSTEKVIEKNQIDTSATASTDKPSKSIYIKDKSQYDQSFIRGLDGFDEPIKLVDNYIVIGANTAYFPEDLALNTRTTFTALKDSSNYSLTLTRTNFTNIDFEFQLLDKYDSIVESKSGEVILHSTFFFAAEGEPDFEAGEPFFGQTYHLENDSISLTVKVGLDKDYAGKKRARIAYVHKIKSSKIESPILRLK